MVQEISDIGRFCPARSTCTFTGSRFYIQAPKKKQYKMAIWFVYLHIWYFLKSGDRCWSFIPQCGLCRLPTWGVYTMCILYIQWNIHSIYSVECCHPSLQYDFLFVVLWSLYHTCHARQLSLANWENAALARSRHTLRLVIADICHLYHLVMHLYIIETFASSN